jgi:hypothetical protein
MKNIKYITNISMLFFILSVTLIALSCSKDKVPTVALNPSDCPKEISFKTDIIKIMNDNCISCHNTNNPSAGFDLTNFDGVGKDPSKILSSMKQDGSAMSMPVGSKLPDSTIQKVYCWINQGKLNN